MSTCPSEQREQGAMGRIVAVVMLYVVASAITLAGVYFGVLSLLGGVTISVLGSQVPAALIGAVIAFLGVRYLITVGRLRNELNDSGATFSWSNFRRGARTHERES